MTEHDSKTLSDLYRCYALPARQGESFTDWQARLDADADFDDPPAPLPECQYFDEQTSPPPVQGKKVKTP